MKKCLIALAILFSGVCIGVAISHENEVKKHWEIVNEYRERLFDIESQRLDAETGFYVIDDPIDPIPSLEALVSEGELKKADLVFPTVSQSSQITKIWLEYCNAHKDEVIDGYANSSMVEFETSGVQPFSCVVYFRPGDEGMIKEMITVIENYNKSE